MCLNVLPVRAEHNNAGAGGVSATAAAIRALGHSSGTFRPACASRRLAPMIAEPSDESLMLAYRQGEASAFETLYARHRGGLFRFLARQLRQSHADSGTLAEELFQDVWMRVIHAHDRYRPDAKFSTWLYQIAHNRLADHWRAKQHRPDTPADAQLRLEREAHDDEPERILSAFEQRRRLQLALAELPDDQRETVLLRLEQELSLEEIGRITGVGRETVKSRLRYALDKLRARLNP